MKETDEFDVKLTKQEIDVILNYIHNRDRKRTKLTSDLEGKLQLVLGHKPNGLKHDY